MTAPPAFERPVHFDHLWAKRVADAPDLKFPPIPSTIRYDFSQGIPAPEAFPRQILADLAGRILREDGPYVLEYFDPRFAEDEMVIGYRPLREEIASMTSRLWNREVGPDEIMLTSGSVEAIVTIATATLDPGDGVIVEEASYHRPVQYMRSLGAKILSVPVDRDGLDPDAVERRLREFVADGVKPKFIYTISTFHTPFGVSLSLERRKALLDLAAKWDVLIIEDNVYGRLRFAGSDLPTMASLDETQRVLYVDGFSKTIAPALRLGWVSAPASALKRLEAARTDLGVSQFLARIVEGFLNEGHYEPQLKMVNGIYRQKLDATIEALQGVLGDRATWIVPEGSMYLWLELDARLDVEEGIRRGKELGVLVRPGTLFAMDPGKFTHNIRLCFGRIPLDDIPPAVERLGQAFSTL